MSRRFSIYKGRRCPRCHSLFCYTDDGDLYHRPMVLQEPEVLCSRCRPDSKVSIKPAPATPASLPQYRDITSPDQVTHTTKSSYNNQFSGIQKTSVEGGTGRLHISDDGASVQAPTIEKVPQSSIPFHSGSLHQATEAEHERFGHLAAKPLYYINQAGRHQLDIQGKSNEIDTVENEGIPGQMPVQHEKMFTLDTTINSKLAPRGRTKTGCLRRRRTCTTV